MGRFKTYAAKSILHCLHVNDIYYYIIVIDLLPSGAKSCSVQRDNTAYDSTDLQQPIYTRLLCFLLNTDMFI